MGGMKDLITGRDQTTQVEGVASLVTTIFQMMQGTMIDETATAAQIASGLAANPDLYEVFVNKTREMGISTGADLTATAMGGTGLRYLRMVGEDVCRRWP